MEFGQGVTALPPPIQYVPKGAPPGHYLAPEGMGFGGFHVLLGHMGFGGFHVLCSWFGAPREKPSPLLQGVWMLGVGLCDFSNFCLFITQAGWWSVNRLCRCWGFSTAGFLLVSRGSWWLTAFLNILVHQYLALWREEMRLSVNVKCAELKPAIFRVFNYQEIQNLPLLREIFWHHLKVLTSALCTELKAFGRICWIFHWIFSFAFLPQ